MNDLIQVSFTPPPIPKDWDYNVSVGKVRGFVYKAKNLTENILHELYIAREILSKSGAAGHVKNLNGTNVPLTWENYCQEIGVEKRTANRWLSPKPVVHIAQSTGENEWDTPPKIIESVRQAMGNIDVDPASNDKANDLVGADRYYTAEDTGLNKDWRGNVWMNPPYSQPLVKDFCKTFIEKYEAREIQQGCVLVNNATETIWFQEMLESCTCVCFPKGRVKFIDKEGKPTGAPLQGQAILYFGENDVRFAREFSQYGNILWKKR